MQGSATVAALAISYCACMCFACAGSHGGEHVQVEGSFDNWTTRQQLQRSGREFTVVKLLPPGVYQVRQA